jgi:O-antigen/teichoic acid export membrane protein
MFRKILGTIGTRLVSAFLTLIIWILVARILGAANLGTISLIILAVTIIQLVNNFFGGSALIYMTPRTGIYRLLVPAYLWNVVMTFAGSFLLLFLSRLFVRLEIIPAGYFTEVLVLALVMSLFSVNSMFLLGMEKIRTFNLLTLLQICLLFLVLLFFLFIVKEHGVMSYYRAFLFSYLVVLVLSFVALSREVRRIPLNGMRNLCAEVLRFGTYVQFANIFQQLNYRMGYYFVDFFLGRATLGVFTIGVQLSEALWLIPRSIGMVQITRISNEMDQKYAERLTLTLVKISWMVTLLLLVILLFIPSHLFELVFGNEFARVKPVIATLGAGIVTFSISIVLSQFFSGINKPFHNTISSALGLVLTVTMGFLLIPRFGLIGAGLTTTLSYMVATLYQFIVFLVIAKRSFSDFLLTKSELMLLKDELKISLKGSGRGSATLP